MQNGVQLDLFSLALWYKNTTKLEKLSNFRMIVDSIDNIVRTRHKIEQLYGENGAINLTLQVLKDDFKNINRFLKVK